jgi:hypothetical protein
MPPAEPRIAVVRFQPARAMDVLSGLLGWADIEWDSALMIRVAVRRVRSGGPVVSFPSPGGRPVAFPISAEIHSAVERQVIEQLRRDGHLEARHAQ